jgi:hypothetical protein
MNSDKLRSESGRLKMLADAIDALPAVSPYLEDEAVDRAILLIQTEVAECIQSLRGKDSYEEMGERAVKVFQKNEREGIKDSEKASAQNVMAETVFRKRGRDAAREALRDKADTIFDQGWVENDNNVIKFPGE